MTLRDPEGRENIVERFVNDLFAWLFHLIGVLLQATIAAAALLLIIIGLTRCMSDEAHAGPQDTTTIQETLPCTCSRNC